MITTVYLLIVTGNAVDYHCISAKCQRSRLYAAGRLECDLCNGSLGWPRGVLVGERYLSVNGEIINNLGQSIQFLSVTRCRHWRVA